MARKKSESKIKCTPTEKSIPGCKNFYFNIKSDGSVRFRYKKKVNGINEWCFVQTDPRKDLLAAYKEAEAKLEEQRRPKENPDAEAVSEIKSKDNNGLSLPSKIPEEEFTMDSQLGEALGFYIEKHKSKNKKHYEKLSEGTLEVMKTKIACLNRYGLGKKKLKNLKLADVQDFLWNLAYEYKYEKKGKEYVYSKDYCSKMYSLLHGFFKDMGWKELYYDLEKVFPVDEPDFYRIKAEKQEDRFLTDTETANLRLALTEDSSDISLRGAVLLMLSTALRPEEARAIQFKDFDKENKRLFIRRSISRHSDHDIKTTKTGAKDYVMLTRNDCLLIEKQREMLELFKSGVDINEQFIFIRKKSDYKGNGIFQAEPLLVADPDAFEKDNEGKYLPITYISLYRYVKKMAQKAGIEKTVFPYTCRQTEINRICNKYGFKAAQMVARHKSATTTMRYYSHDDLKIIEKIRDDKDEEDYYDYEDELKMS